MAPIDPQLQQAPHVILGNTSSLPASTPTPPTSLLTRAQRFVEENQRLILLGAAVAASAGAGYYLYATRSSSSRGPGSPGPSTGSRKSKKNKKKKGTKDEGFLKGQGNQGPLVEEIPGKADEVKETKEEKAGEEVQEPGTSHLNGVCPDPS